MDSFGAYLSEEEIPEWVSIYYAAVPKRGVMKCNLCEIEFLVSAKSPVLMEHLKDTHRDVYDLHKDNPEATVGFRVEFLHLNVLKDDDDDGKQQVIVGDVCETTTEPETVSIPHEQGEEEEGAVISMQYVMLDSKRKNRRASSNEARRRSWIWKYFDRLSNIVYRCNICNVVLSTKGANTNNLNRHMRSKHVAIFSAEKFGGADSKDNTVDVSSEVDTPDPIKTEEIYASNKEVTDSPSGKLRRSWVWSYFDFVSPTQAQCKLCRRHINHGGNATGNMNRHLKMIHHKTQEERDYSWVWKVFEKEDSFYTCKICQHKLGKSNPDSDLFAISGHLKREHGVVSGDQIITGTECDDEN